MKNKFWKALFIFTILFSFFYSKANANIVDDFYMDWNAGDALAVQKNFNKDEPRSMAEAGALAEKGGLITKILEVKDRVYAINLETIKGNKTIVLAKCTNSEKFCYFGARENTSFGSAEAGQLADVGTTAAGIGFFGAKEANPLGWLILPLKVGMLTSTRGMDWEGCIGWRAGLDMVGYGASAANIATLIGVPFPVNLFILAGVTLSRDETAIENAMYECSTFALEA